MKNCKLNVRTLDEGSIPAEINLIEKEAPGKYQVKSLLPQKENDNKKAKGVRIWKWVLFAI